MKTKIFFGIKVEGSTKMGKNIKISLSVLSIDYKKRLSMFVKNQGWFINIRYVLKTLTLDFM